ncbi:MAG: PTS sugar transporter subunit IIC [Desulfuromonadaceae bacterium]|nr:PTS sugar transporter subunit IIC [Desulfuromonadaceae bacterium]
MFLFELTAAALISVVAGIDRTAGPQIMLSRPLVAAPLTGLVLGSPVLGLEVGILLELLWMARVPAGASIPPDDTQIAVGATFLSVVFADYFRADPQAVMVLAVLISCPLGRIGVYFDRRAREFNDRGNARIQRSVKAGNIEEVEGVHLLGLLYFGLSSLLSFLVIVLAGAVILMISFASLEKLLLLGGGFIKTIFPLIGAVAIIGTMRIHYTVTLFMASFTSTLLLLWYF